MLRGAATLDDLGDAYAPAPVEPGDLVATANQVFVVDAVLPTPVARCVPALARELDDAAQLVAVLHNELAELEP